MSQGNAPKFYRFEGQRSGLSKKSIICEATIPIDILNSPSIKNKKKNNRIQMAASTTFVKVTHNQRQLTEYTVPPLRFSVRSDHQLLLRI